MSSVLYSLSLRIHAHNDNEDQLVFCIKLVWKLIPLPNFELLYIIMQNLVWKFVYIDDAKQKQLKLHSISAKQCTEAQQWIDEKVERSPGYYEA